jgi:hypothetical protein
MVIVDDVIDHFAVSTRFDQPHLPQCFEVL